MDVFKFFLTRSQVRGTPGTGKTSLAELLECYITKQEPTTHVIWMHGWPYDDVKARGRWKRYFEIEKGWIENQKSVFIFDEAQLSYVDGEFWNNFFKSIHIYSNCRAIAFMSYGSPATRIMIQGTPIIIPDERRVTLRAIQHKDGLPCAGLFFSRVEFDNLVSTMYPSPKYLFDKSFFDGLFDLTDGHVGAITEFIHIILAHEVGPVFPDPCHDLKSYSSHIVQSGTSSAKLTNGLHLCKKSARLP